MERTRTLITAAVIVTGVALLISVRALSDAPKKKSAARRLAHARPAAGGKKVATVKATVKKKVKKKIPAGDRLMYTTYFYTANEAVIHGYQMGTGVRIVSLADRAGRRAPVSRPTSC